jgi:hypothetical protein
MRALTSPRLERVPPFSAVAYLRLAQKNRSWGRDLNPATRKALSYAAVRADDAGRIAFVWRQAGSTARTLFKALLDAGFLVRVLLRGRVLYRLSLPRHRASRRDEMQRGRAR